MIILVFEHVPLYELVRTKATKFCKNGVLRGTLITIQAMLLMMERWGIRKQPLLSGDI